MDFKQSLDHMTYQLRSAGRRITLPRVPKWADGDATANVYDELPVLLRDGQVYYSCVVQANRSLFDNTADAGSMISAAMIIYNHNRGKPSIVNPEYMIPFAHYLFMCKRKEPSEIPEWIADAVNVVRGETNRSRIIITSDDDENYHMNLTLQSVMVFRSHLFKMRLGGAVVPIVAAPEKCSSVLMLPYWFWGKEFEDYWDASL